MSAEASSLCSNAHFFAETANEVSPPDFATSVIAKSLRIAQNFENGIAFQRAGNHPDHAAK
jgi:ribosomal protein S3